MNTNILSDVELYPHELGAFLTDVWSSDVHVPVMIWGPPGVGKSQIAATVASGLGRTFVDFRPSMRDPVDLSGVPEVIDRDGHRVASWSRPSFLPTEATGPSVLALEEIVSAAPSMQGALYQLVHDRTCGDHILPSDCKIVAMGNREGDRGIVYEMPTPLASRFVHVTLATELASWCEWYVSTGLPIEVAMFLRFRPDLLHDFDPMREEKAFPCPRTWELAGKLRAVGMPIETQLRLLVGTVGTAAALEFEGFCRVMSQLPSPDFVIRKPDSADIPSEPAALYALCGALARMADTSNADRVATYAGRLAPEFSTLLMTTAAQCEPDIQRTPAFTKWAIANDAA